MDYVFLPERLHNIYKFNFSGNKILKNNQLSNIKKLKENSYFTKDLENLISQSDWEILNIIANKIKEINFCEISKGKKKYFFSKKLNLFNFLI